MRILVLYSLKVANLRALFISPYCFSRRCGPDAAQTPGLKVFFVFLKKKAFLDIFSQCPSIPAFFFTIHMFCRNVAPVNVN